MSLHDFISHGTDNVPKSFLFILASTWIVYQFVKSTYNLFFHPLSYIPGPKLAAATYLPEFYCDVVRSGRYTTYIRQMHEQYGIKSFAILPNLHWHSDIRTQALLFALIPTKSTAAIVISSRRFTLQEAENVTSLYTRSGAAGCKVP